MDPNSSNSSKASHRRRTTERAARVDLDGLLLLDKPSGMSSNAALQRARGLLGARKAGHGGTLDPLASGILPLLFGEATKFAGRLLTASKRYRAVLHLGVKTATADAEGEVLGVRPVNAGRDDVLAALARFRGEIDQVPPMHSALKRDGVPLYVHARQGHVVAREARRITIHALELVAMNGDFVEIDVQCSKGTYVRTLAEDIGEALGCGAHLASLRRTGLGAWTQLDCVSLEALERAQPDERGRHVQPVGALLGDVRQLILDEPQAQAVGHGRALALGAVQAGEYAVFGPDHRFLGLGLVDDEGRFTPRRLVRQQDEAQPTE